MGDQPLVGVDGQAGDVGVGDVAGGNVIHGLTGNDVGALLGQLELWRAKDRAYEADRLSMELKRQERERDERELRQRMLDERLRAITAQGEAAAAAAHRAMVVGIVLSVVVGIAVLILAALVYDRLAVIAGLTLGTLVALRMR